jgi:hypothetical protein
VVRLLVDVAPSTSYDSSDDAGRRSRELADRGGCSSESLKGFTSEELI